ncbi:MAG: (deoxy)nucleoside triphosphate pyrophosphohydrolase [Prevotella sp.]|jgi:8-oxo-dGTP diphosphatase|nr:(deoxy)nucleoside triphosphate pyrophosphohydrolase [Prevotella sp.]MCH3995732.1 (deoxy)nucleoside triphosphate pyrophosphohydrolase [Prevotella sp.]
MKTIHVVAAIIEQDSKYFATQRGYGEFKDWWEFPGGKIEVGETPQVALKREIEEELNTSISVGQLIKTVDCDYSAFRLHMRCFLCHVVKGSLQLLEAEDAKWLNKDELNTVKWLPADKEVVDILQGK